MLKAVIKIRASEDVMNQIAALITGGTLKKGDQLPSERELSETCKVSRATVREAIRSLESRGMIETRQGNGTYVLVSGDNVGVSQLAASLMTERDELIDIFEIRKIIEPSIAQLAAKYANSKDIAELEGILAQQRMGVAAGKYMAETDALFHLTLARISKNRILSRLVQAIVELLSNMEGEYLATASRASKSLQGHAKILDAVASEDCVAARHAMIDHLNKVENLFKDKRKGGGKCREVFEE
jgi:GntR family transcriptional repressor for pyruvate dehydrogenase complex